MSKKNVAAVDAGGEHNVEFTEAAVGSLEFYLMIYLLFGWRIDTA